MGFLFGSNTSSDLAAKYIANQKVVPSIIDIVKRYELMGSEKTFEGNEINSPSRNALQEKLAQQKISWIRDPKNPITYVEAARLRGEKTGWIIFREILPNALSPLAAEMGLRFIFMVLFISTLSFLGLGVQPPQADWGGIVKENKEGINYGIQAALYPAYAIATLCISINLVADWILNRTTSLKGGRG